MMKYELTFKADNVDELFNLFDNLKNKITNITVEIGDDAETEEPAPKPKKKRAKKEEPAMTTTVDDTPTANDDTPTNVDDTLTADDDTPTYTLIDVQRKFKDKASGGNKAHLREILQHYNAGRVSELDPKYYADVMQELDLVEA